MQYTKRPVSFFSQLQLLRDRGLGIADETLAIKQLHSVSYFRLASYFRYMEQDVVSHQFKPGSVFGDVISLYVFDNQLRSLIFTAIQDIEIALRTRLVHFTSMKYGSFWFMNSALFKEQTVFQQCLDKVHSEVNRSKEDFIQEYFSRYTSPDLPPAWKTFEVVSFGTLSKMFCNLKDTEIKKKVAKSFGLPQYVYLESWVKCAVALRNCCAHHECIWNKRFPIIPRLPQRLPLLWITNTAIRPVKIYAHLCYLAYLEQSVNPNGNFKGKLMRHLQNNPTVDLHAMGFPRGWAGEPLWQ